MREKVKKIIRMYKKWSIDVLNRATSKNEFDILFTESGYIQLLLLPSYEPWMITNISLTKNLFLDIHDIINELSISIYFKDTDKTHILLYKFEEDSEMILDILQIIYDKFCELETETNHSRRYAYA